MYICIYVNVNVYMYIVKQFLQMKSIHTVFTANSIKHDYCGGWGGIFTCTLLVL
jgi:hypothetical protein